MNAIDRILLSVEKPARYVGGEYNQPDCTKPHKVSFCLAFPDLYEVGMSNLGIKILYDILNRDPDVVCERCFTPWVDMGKALSEQGIPLFSLETRRPLKDFDLLGFSIQYELALTNVLYMLDLAGIPFFPAERSEDDPILFAGGPCTANPEPFAPFFDLICIGDGEEVNLAVAKIVAKYKGNRRKILEECQKIDGIYAPSLTETENGICITPVKKAVVKNLDAAPFPTAPLVPNIEVTHDRPVVELYRGCYAACRFCQACFFYRPVRVRSQERILTYAKELIASTGADELGISSLSSGDYPDICGLLRHLHPLAEREKVKLQLPSLRLDSYSEELTGDSRRGSLTFAPEAGTQRLRDVINKNITEEDVDHTMRLAFGQGYRAVKLYFMIGLPTEWDEDLLGIAALAAKIRKIYIEVTGKRDLTITVSTSMFVPKPLTPFQWAEQIGVEEMKRRVSIVRAALRSVKGVNYNWHEETASMLEGVFARGDRALADVVVRAYRSGCRFDGWNEHFRYDLWMQAFADCGIDPFRYTAAQAEDKVFAWDFIDFGVKKSFLLKEWRRALCGEKGESCKFGCKGCGANRYAACKVQNDVSDR